MTPVPAEPLRSRQTSRNDYLLQSATPDKLLLAGSEKLCLPDQIITQGEFAQLAARFFGLK